MPPVESYDQVLPPMESEDCDKDRHFFDNKKMGTNTIYGEPLYFGQTPKYHLEIEATGLGMDEYDFSVRLQRGTNSIVIPKSEMIVDNGDYFLGFDTRRLGVGTVRAIVIAEIPDTDFPDGIRTEISVIEHFTEILAL